VGQIQLVFQERWLDFGQFQDIEKFLKDGLSLLTQQWEKLNALIDKTSDKVLSIRLLIKHQDLFNTLQAFEQDPSMLFMNEVFKVRQKSLNGICISGY
jgi:hypothetical protein